MLAKYHLINNLFSNITCVQGSVPPFPLVFKFDTICEVMKIGDAIDWINNFGDTLSVKFVYHVELFKKTSQSKCVLNLRDLSLSRSCKMGRILIWKFHLNTLSDSGVIKNICLKDRCKIEVLIKLLFGKWLMEI